jgi:hypothetical protein
MPAAVPNDLTVLSPGGATPTRKQPTRRETIMSLVEMLLESHNDDAAGQGNVCLTRPDWYPKQILPGSSQSPNFEDDRDVRK